jgi:hypothetical protein
VHLGSILVILDSINTSTQLNQFHPNLHTRRSPTYTYSRCPINTTDSPDDERRGAQNTQRNGIYTKKELCIKLVIYKN